MTKIPEGLSCTVTVTPSDVYPGGIPNIPDGWEFVAFRVGENTEYVLAPGSHPRLADSGENEPRVIIRRKLAKRRFSVIVESNHEPTEIMITSLDMWRPSGRSPLLTVTEVREVKPITRRQIHDAVATSWMGPLATGIGIVLEVMVKLGIKVED